MAAAPVPSRRRRRLVGLAAVGSGAAAAVCGLVAIVAGSSTVGDRSRGAHPAGVAGGASLHRPVPHRSGVTSCAGPDRGADRAGRGDDEVGDNGPAVADGEADALDHDDDDHVGSLAAPLTRRRGGLCPAGAAARRRGAHGDHNRRDRRAMPRCTASGSRLTASSRCRTRRTSAGTGSARHPASPAPPCSPLTCPGTTAPGRFSGWASSSPGPSSTSHSPTGRAAAIRSSPAPSTASSCCRARGDLAHDRSGDARDADLRRRLQPGHPPIRRQHRRDGRGRGVVTWFSRDGDGFGELAIFSAKLDGSIASSIS